MLREPLLAKLLDERFCAEAGVLHDTVFLPLGEKVERVLARLVARDTLPAGRVLQAIPHPSPANVERIQFFLGQKDAQGLSKKADPAKMAAMRAAILTRVSQLGAASH